MVGIELAYRILAWVPVLLSVLAIGYEMRWGFHRFAEVAWHLSYDISYFLVLVGLLLILKAVIKRHVTKSFLISLFLASIPLLQLIFQH
jgi:hypothetical protein